MTPEPPTSTLPLSLELTIVDDALHVVLVNESDAELRVWARANSWGDAAWSIELHAGARSHVLRATNQGYTRNVPRVIALAPGDRHELVLRPKQREWTAGEDLSHLRDVELDVQIALDIASSPEAIEQHVALGSARSAPLRSRPPHAWLF